MIKMYILRFSNAMCLDYVDISREERERERDDNLMHESPTHLA